MIIHVYSKPSCSYCTQAKALLRSHNLPFNHYDVSKDEKALHYIKNVLNSRTVPVVIIEEKGVMNHIGGFTELKAYLEKDADDPFDNLF